MTEPFLESPRENEAARGEPAACVARKGVELAVGITNGRGADIEGSIDVRGAGDVDMLLFVLAPTMSDRFLVLEFLPLGGRNGK